MEKLLLLFSMVATFVTMSLACPIQNYNPTIILDEDPSCPAVTDLTVSDITGVSGRISWTAVESEDEVTYTLEYSLAGQNIWNTETSSLTAPSFILGGLEPLTTYDVRVKTNCEGNAYSAWDTITFTTTCLSGGEIEIGTSTYVDDNLPSHSLYKYGYSQQLFTANEIGYATNIYALSINMQSAPSPRRLEFYLMPTTATNVSSWIPTSGAQPVYTGTQTLTSGWNRFEFSEPFVYNGTDNLLLIIVDKTGSWTNGNWSYVTSAFANCARYTYGDSVQYSIATLPTHPGTALNMRNNVIFSGDCNESVTCLPPTMNVENITGVSAEVNWTAGYQETTWEMKYKAVDDAEWINVPNPNNGYQTIEGLTPNTVYELSMRSLCGAQNTSDWVTTTFRTGCGIQPIPFHENFNTYGIGQSAFPSCWTPLNTYSYPYPYITTPNNLDSTGGSLYFMASNTTYNAAVTPELDANISALTVSFYLRVTNLGNGMIVGVMNTANDMSTFVPVDTVFCSATSSFEYKEVFMNTYSGTGKYIAFKNLVTASSYSDRMMWMDDLVIVSTSSCNRPSNLEIVSTTETSVQLTWTETGQAQNWNIEYNTMDFEPGTDAGMSLSVSTNPYTVTELEVGTTYYFYVQANCGDDAVSSWCGPVHVSTMCEVFNMPFVETFNEVTSGIPACWDNREGTTTNEDYKWGLLNNGMEGHGMYFDSYFNGFGNTNALKTPRINIGASAVLKFYYKNPTGGDLSVYAIVNGTQTLLVGGLVDTAAWTPQTCDLSAYNGQVVQISFVGTSNCGTGNAYIYLDSVSVKTGTTPGPQPEICNAPTDLTVYNITANSADIDWSQTGTPDSWTIYYKKTSETDWTSIAHVTTRPYTLTNLNPETAYRVKMVAICGENTSEESSIANFITDPDGVNEYANSTVLYPNPTNGQFTIHNTQCTIERVEVMDVYGKLLKTVEVNDNTTSIDVTNYASGVYFARVHTDKGIVTKRIVKK